MCCPCYFRGGGIQAFFALRVFVRSEELLSWSIAVTKTSGSRRIVCLGFCQCGSNEGIAYLDQEAVPLLQARVCF